MTHKAIRYSSHASQRMQQRDVRRSDVRRALAVGDIRPADEYGVRQAHLAVRSGTLVLHFKESNTGIYIITVYIES